MLIFQMVYSQISLTQNVCFVYLASQPRKCSLKKLNVVNERSQERCGQHMRTSIPHAAYMHGKFAKECIVRGACVQASVPRVVSCLFFVLFLLLFRYLVIYYDFV